MTLSFYIGLFPCQCYIYEPFQSSGRLKTSESDVYTRRQIQTSKVDHCTERVKFSNCRRPIT